MMTPPSIEQRVAHLEAELTRLSHLLQTSSSSSSQSHSLDPTDGSPRSLPTDLPLGVFANDPYFEEIVQRMRDERELDADNPAYT